MRIISPKLLCICAVVIGVCAGSASAQTDSRYQPYYGTYSYASDNGEQIVTGQKVNGYNAGQTDNRYQQGSSTYSYMTDNGEKVVTGQKLNRYTSDKSEPIPAPVTHSVDLGTQGGFDIGVQGSAYHFQSHIVSNSQYYRQDGGKFGLTGTGTSTFKYGLFVTAEGRFAYSDNSYESDKAVYRDYAGDVLGEIHLLAGKDFLISGDHSSNAVYDLSPYVGLGFRDDYNDSSGKINNTTIDIGGQRINNEYFYIPVGLTQRMALGPQSRLSVNFEYDHLYLGRNTTYTNDSSTNLPNATFNQNSGFGLRAYVSYDWGDWSAGPFVNYWNINQSRPDIFTSTFCGGTKCIGDVPHNQTWEWGGQVKYHLW